MLKLEVKSKQSPKKVVDQLKTFFGNGGLGLDLNEESSDCLSFQGGGGYVTAAVCPEGNGSRIEFVTQEWDYQVKKIAAEIS